MLDIKFIRENKDLVAQAAQHKNRPVDLDRLLELDDKRRELLSKVQTLREERNVLAQKGNSDEARTRGKDLKDELKKLEDELSGLDEEYTKLLLSVPNITHPDMPVGKDDSENVTLRTWGDIRTFDFTIRDHMELGEMLDIIDTQTASQVSGSRFYYLKGKAVLLQFGLINYVMQTLMNRDIVGAIAKKVNSPFDTPFTPVLPPVIMKAEVMNKMDRLYPTDDRYYFEKDDLVFIGSAEHTLGPIYMDKTLKEAELPIRLIGYSTAFRREAGSYGKDTKGILRAHQFDKLEMESFTPAENGDAEQQLFVGLQEYMLQELGIPYRILDVCTGDTGKPDYRQIDVECWIPSQGKYRETHSADYMTDYQARRLNIRYETADKKKEYVHMNDATAFAIGRTLIAIMENYQQADGSITVPKVLQSLVGFDTISA